jgi:hypothetical protein
MENDCAAEIQKHLLDWDVQGREEIKGYRDRRSGVRELIKYAGGEKRNDVRADKKIDGETIKGDRRKEDKGNKGINKWKKQMYFSHQH